jgi:hypothetical protein
MPRSPLVSFPRNPVSDSGHPKKLISARRSQGGFRKPPGALSGGGLGLPGVLAAGCWMGFDLFAEHQRIAYDPDKAGGCFVVVSHKS